MTRVYSFDFRKEPASDYVTVQGFSGEHDFEWIEAQKPHVVRSHGPGYYRIRLVESDAGPGHAVAEWVFSASEEVALGLGWRPSLRFTNESSVTPPANLDKIELTPGGASGVLGLLRTQNGVTEQFNAEAGKWMISKDGKWMISKDEATAPIAAPEADLFEQCRREADDWKYGNPADPLTSLRQAVAENKAANERMEKAAAEFKARREEYRKKPCPVCGAIRISDENDTVRMAPGFMEFGPVSIGVDPNGSEKIEKEVAFDGCLDCLTRPARHWEALVRRVFDLETGHRKREQQFPGIEKAEAKTMAVELTQTIEVLAGAEVERVLIYERARNDNSRRELEKLVSAHVSGLAIVVVVFEVLRVVSSAIFGGF